MYILGKTVYMLFMDKSEKYILSLFFLLSWKDLEQTAQIGAQKNQSYVYKGVLFFLTSIKFVQRTELK